MAYSAPQMGTSALLYGESNATDVIMSKLDDSKVKDPNAKLGIRRVILSEVVRQMLGFQPLLDKTLTESGTFVVYDATPIVQNWKLNNPKLLDKFYKTTSVEWQINESASKNKSTASTVINNSGVNPHKFVLLGWVDSIHESENRTPISGTGKVALLYSLEIRCEYRLINPENNRVVAVFIVVGHGGIARILGTGSATINYDAKLITTDMFNSLADDIRHVLRVREDEYIKKKINAKKINVSMPLPTK